MRTNRLPAVPALLLLAVGVALLVGGAVAGSQGLAARRQVQAELLAQRITTPPDASIPGARVRDARTAEAMAEVIGVHAERITGGRTYAELGREDPLRRTALEASSLRTGLYLSVMAQKVSELVIGVGALLLVLGTVLIGLAVHLGQLVPVRRRAGVPAEVGAAPAPA